MGGVITEFGGPVTVVYQSEEDRTYLETTLTAVVAWREGRASHTGWRSRLRRWQFQWGLDPINRRFSIGRESGLWYGSAGRHGQQMTLFHPVRRVVRVLDREYLLAGRGLTTVLLIDETGDSPAVRELQIPAPKIARTAEQLDYESGATRHDALAEELRVWRAAIQTQPEIKAFLDAP